jgi:inner membrane protein
MDPITHTCVGAGLSAAGLRQTTALATPTLILAANAPDIDILSALAGPYTSLAFRRGITHGIPALLVLPILVAGLMLAWDRWIRLRRAPEVEPARPGLLLALASLGVWTHPILDWLNNYGIRWFLPFDGSWSYGDAVFILDPWLWLLVVGPAFLTWSSSRLAQALWVVLAGLLTLPMALADVVPEWARIFWLMGLLTWIVLRVRHPSGGITTRRVVRLSLAAGGVYIALMVGQTSLAERAALEEADRAGMTPSAIMVAPVPADPLAGQVVVQEDQHYWTGTFHWTRIPRVEWTPRPLPRQEHATDPAWLAAVALAQADSRGERYLTWSRFPLYRVETSPQDCLLRLSDVRYLDRNGSGGALTGPAITLDRQTFPGTDLCP